MLSIGYDSRHRRATFACEQGENETPWFLLLRRTLEDKTQDLRASSKLEYDVPWWSFLSVLPDVQGILKGYRVTPEVTPEAREQLQKAKERRGLYKDAEKALPIEEADLKARLSVAGFTRTLTPEQIRNVCKLVPLPAGATFSVPGAGKTTEALSYFFVNCAEIDKLLVIAPKNAFGAWDEQMEQCMNNKHGKFVRLRGNEIESQLKANPRFMLITYQQLARVPELIASFIAQHETFVYLDESHRIKSGKGKVTADAILGMSYLPKGKLIMSGTPMPQSDKDLIPQFSFLYPEIEITPENVADLIKPIYVRTTKGELNLPPVTRHLIELNMHPVQAKLYNLMKFEVARQAEQTLNRANKQALRALGRSVMRLLELVSNPALLATEIGVIQRDMLSEVLAEGDSPKIQYACKKARKLAKEGKKVLIWSTFRENVEIIANRLADLGAVYIHGAVDAGDEDDEESREGKIKIFHYDPNCFVMVANPAAASEGISLHKVCHHAIYVDRTYNAAHYLQSEDRIHRLGLGQDETTTLEILECRGTIDESVRTRLKLKTDRMAQALEDNSLCIDPIPFDQFDVEDTVEAEIGSLDVDDVKDLLANLRGAP